MEAGAVTIAVPIIEARTVELETVERVAMVPDGKGVDGNSRVAKVIDGLVDEAVVPDAMETDVVQWKRTSMFLGKDGAVVTVGLHIKIVSPGISRPLLGSPVFVVDTLVTSRGVPDVLVTDTGVADALVSERVAGGSGSKDPAEAR